jgi:hypothetical protein
MIRCRWVRDFCVWSWRGGERDLEGERDEGVEEGEEDYDRISMNNS